MDFPVGMPVSDLNREGYAVSRLQFLDAVRQFPAVIEGFIDISLEIEDLNLGFVRPVQRIYQPGLVEADIVGALGLHFRNGLLVFQALVSVPAALSGGIIAAWLSGQDVSIATLVGLIAVAGIAARNVIMLLTRYQSLAREEGMPFGNELILRGTAERVAPILMTALTAAFALVPLALAGGAPGKEILQPMSIVIIGGLLSSTLLSLVLTPAAYRLLGGNLQEVTEVP